MNHTIAVPSNKRMAEDSLAYLAGRGLTFARDARRLTAKCNELAGLQAAFLDYKDIATFVGNGAIEFGITTSAALKEYKSSAQVVCPLDFSHCRIAFAAAAPVPDVREWKGSRVAAKYPVLAEAFFRQAGRSDVKIIPVSGSSEAYPVLGLADGIVDVVQSGASLVQNNLHELATLMQVQAVLVQKPGAPSPLLHRLI